MVYKFLVSALNIMIIMLLTLGQEQSMQFIVAFLASQMWHQQIAHSLMCSSSDEELCLCAGLVFEGIGFFEVGFATMAGKLDWLTKHLICVDSYVPATDAVSMLRQRLKPINAGHVQ